MSTSVIIGYAVVLVIALILVYWIRSRRKAKKAAQTPIVPVDPLEALTRGNNTPMSPDETGFKLDIKPEPGREFQIANTHVEELPVTTIPVSIPGVEFAKPTKLSQTESYLSYQFDRVVDQLEALRVDILNLTIPRDGQTEEPPQVQPENISTPNKSPSFEQPRERKLAADRMKAGRLAKAQGAKVDPS